MKKWMALWMAALIMLMSVAALAEESSEAKLGSRTAEQVYEELIVGSTTMLSGRFFTDMWGNNTSDIDVRELLHAYNMVRWNSEEGAFVMDESVVSGITWTLDEQGNKTYIIALADDLYYSDGSRITARDYAFSILLSASPEVVKIGGMTTGADHIQGVEAYKGGGAGTISGARLLSDAQLSITVSAEYLPFFYELALINYNPYPISEIAPGCEVADDGEGIYIRNVDRSIEEKVFTAELLETTIMDAGTGYMSHPSVVSGPYVLTGYDASSGEATFEINPYYKGNSDGQKPTIQRLTFKEVKADTMIEQLQNGQIDLLNKCAQADVINGGFSAMEADELNSSNYMRSGMAMLSFNCEKGPVQFEKVRQAIALCLDRDAFIEGYVGGYGTEVNGYYGIGQWMTQLVNGSITPPAEDPGEDADEEAKAEYEAKMASWNELTLDGLNDYALDIDAARALLIEDGWTLNEAGDPFNEDEDEVRCKMVDGELMKLTLSAIVPEGSAAARLLDETMTDNLKVIGVKLSIGEVPFTELLEQYYRQQSRDCDMICLGTNFETVFDPTYVYSTEDAYQGSKNTTGLRDEKLMELAADMSKTEAGDVLAYCQKWVAFQEYWNGILPAIPLYSNIYFDFHASRLQNYHPGEHTTWSQAVLYAYLSDATEEEQAGSIEAEAILDEEVVSN